MSYVYPLVGKVTTGRIDQGQDFGGTGSVLAIGDAKVVKIGAPGWPGGGRGVLYQLLNGPLRGRYIFNYEAIVPTVRAGQIVKAGQPIGHLVPGSSSGIEMGFAKPNGEPISHSEYEEGKETKGGKAFAAFLSSLKKGGGSGGGPSIWQAALGAIPEGPAAAAAIGATVDATGNVIGGAAQEAAGAVGKEVVNYLAGILGEKALPILLNVALVGGGAFLVYYGLAKSFGTSEPVKKLADMSAQVATTVATKGKAQ